MSITAGDCGEHTRGAMIGVLWPWGSEGEYPPEFPYCERCDMCALYDSDHEAAEALARSINGIVVLIPCSRGDFRIPAVYPRP